MKSEFKIFSNWKLGLYKFIGDVKVEDILKLLQEGYSNKEFKTITHTLLDFRECSFTFELNDVVKIVTLVEKNKNINVNIKTALIVGEPKVTALSTYFSTKLKILKDIKIVSSIYHLIQVFDLSISEEQLESLFKEMIPSN